MPRKKPRKGPWCETEPGVCVHVQVRAGVGGSRAAGAVPGSCRQPPLQRLLRLHHQSVVPGQPAAPQDPHWWGLHPPVLACIRQLLRTAAIICCYAPVQANSKVRYQPLSLLAVLAKRATDCMPMPAGLSRLLLSKQAIMAQYFIEHAVDLRSHTCSTARCTHACVSCGRTLVSLSRPATSRTHASECAEHVCRPLRCSQSIGSGQRPALLRLL